MDRRIILFFSLTLISFIISTANGQQEDPPFLKYLNHPWVDSVMNTLTLEEKTGQLIWIAAYSNRDISYDYELSNKVKELSIGGLVFFQGTARKQVEMINHLRNISRVPPIMALDGEWGAGMRLDGFLKFPYQMTLGAIRDDSLIYYMGRKIGSQFRKTGLNINLAPVADVNINPLNPVINYRSFGEEPENVKRKSLYFMRGMQDEGIIAVAKHFPGHGDTETDSHYDIPVVRHSRELLDSDDLFPFRALINNGVSGIMPGHIWIPSLEPDSNRPATISQNIITGLLKKKLGFQGLIISDAMNMKGITGYSKAGGAEAMALKAGQDVLEFITDPASVIKDISERIEKGEIREEIINEKCRKVLAAKYWAGLNKPVIIKTEEIDKYLADPVTEVFIRKLYENAMTLLNNENNIIPLLRPDTLRIATLAINSGSTTEYQRVLSRYVHADHFFISTDDTIKTGELFRSLRKYNLVIGGIFGTDQRASKDFGIPDWLNGLLNRLNANSKCIITWFGNPYAITRMEEIQRCTGLLVAYQENAFTQETAAQLIFGATGACGTLPVTINEKYPSGSGINTEGGIRVKFNLPESTGLGSEYLNKRIDSIVNEGLNAGAYPGCEVMVAHKGTVIFEKSYGFHTYEKKAPVCGDDLYDLASVTKICGPVPCLMKLEDEGKFSPENTLGYYLRSFRNSNKSPIVMKDILAHQAGFESWIPFWKATVRKNGDFRRSIFSCSFSDKYPFKVAESIYVNRNYKEKLYREIRKSKLSAEKKYVYSDLGFILIPEIISSLTGEQWDVYLTKNVFDKLGANDICFNPCQKYSPERIIPTEYDSLFRKQLLHGYVHDEGAAMLGGVSGHAGLFATANDLMKLLEMYRRMGNYGGEQLISKETLKKYISYQFPENKNRRGLGFDKPQIDITTTTVKDPYPAKSCTPVSFGHSGYTGPFVWVDPEKELTYLFLCNRVYPTRENNKLVEKNIRTSILQAIYDSIDKGI